MPRAIEPVSVGEIKVTNQREFRFVFKGCSSHGSGFGSEDPTGPMLQ